MVGNESIHSETGVQQNNPLGPVLFALTVDEVARIGMEVAFSPSDYLPTLSAAKTSKLSLLVKHHILAIDEAS